MFVPPGNLAIEALILQQFRGHEGERPSPFEALAIRISVARIHNGGEVKVVQHATFVVFLVHEVVKTDIAVRDPNTPEQGMAYNSSSIPSRRRKKERLTAKGMPKGHPEVTGLEGVDGLKFLREYPELNTKPTRGS